MKNSLLSKAPCNHKIPLKYRRGNTLHMTIVQYNLTSQGVLVNVYLFGYIMTIDEQGGELVILILNIYRNIF